MATKIAAEYVYTAQQLRDEVALQIGAIESAFSVHNLTIEQRIRLVELKINLAELDLKIERTLTR